MLSTLAFLPVMNDRLWEIGASRKAIFLLKISSLMEICLSNTMQFAGEKIANKFDKLRSLIERQEINREANDDKKELKVVEESADQGKLENVC